jgi:cytochrome c553
MLMKPYLLAAAVAVTAPADAPDWLFPRPSGPRAPVVADDAPISMPGSTVTLQGRDLRTAERAIDWFPDPADPVPAFIRESGKPGEYACGFCHLPRGNGRPENASLSGLSVAYIIEQTDAFRTGSRLPANPGWLPSEAMRTTVQHASRDEIAAAARWFSRQPFVSRVKIVESATVPATAPLGYILAVRPGPAEAIAGRLIEVPDDIEAFEHRDPRSTFTAFVPPGSIARGSAIAGELGCKECHAEMLDGWGPGRSPSYILRQLYAFKARTRTTPRAETMQTVVDQLDNDQRVAVAAWMAAQPVER